MPGYRTHLTFGALVFVFVSYFMSASFGCFIDFSVLMHTLVPCLIGSIFPDIDTASKMQRIFYFLAAFFMISALFINNLKVFLIFALLSLLIFFIKHRTITHNPILLAVLTGSFAVLCYLKNGILSANQILLFIFFVIGTLSHVFLDYFVSKILKK